MKKRELKRRIRDLEDELALTRPAYSTLELYLGDTGGPSYLSIPIETTRRHAESDEMTAGRTRFSLPEIGYTVTYNGTTDA